MCILRSAVRLPAPPDFWQVFHSDHHPEPVFRDRNERCQSGLRLVTAPGNPLSDFV